MYLRPCTNQTAWKGLMKATICTEQFEFGNPWDCVPRQTEDQEEWEEEEENEENDWDYPEDGPRGGWSEWDGEVSVRNAYLYDELLVASLYNCDHDDEDEVVDDDLSDDYEFFQHT